MNLRTLLGWSLAATFLAACSGGAGSVSPSTPGNNNAITTGSAIRIIAPINMGPSSSNRRSPDYIGTNVNTIAYSFTPGPITGQFTGSGGVFTGCTASGMPVVQTCNVALAPGTYALTVTLKNGATVVGSGTAAGIVINSGAVTGAPVNIQPIASGPSLSIPSGATQFYNDGHAQTITMTGNELDPAGDIITTYYGPVAALPAYTYTLTGGASATTGITAPANIAVNTPPTIQAGYNAESLMYTGTAGNTTSLGVTLSDGTSTSSVTVPYVSLSNNAANPSANNITFSATGVGGAQTFTVTETTSAASGGLDTTVTSTSPTPCGAHATFTPALAATNPLNIAGPSGTITYSVVAVDALISTCTVKVASNQDPNLATTVTINFPGTAGVGVH
jgi:hypothetical protein